MDFATTRAALKAAYTSTIPAVDLSSDPEAPCGITMPRTPFDLHEFFEDENSESHWTVLLLVPWADNASAQADMDGYLQSVPAAIEADTSLGGVVASTEAFALQAYGVDTLADGGRQFLMAEIVVHIVGLADD